MQEHFTEIGRTSDTAARPPEYRRTLADSEQGVTKLRYVLAATPIDKPAADAAVKSVAASCTSCHQAHRD